MRERAFASPSGADGGTKTIGREPGPGRGRESDRTPAPLSSAHGRRAARPRMPAIPFEADAALRVEDHFLPLEAEALENSRRAVVASEADPAPRVDDAMPRDPAAL